MPRVRTAATELAALFNSAEQPVYLLDRDGIVVFCNRACLEWLGVDDLRGQRAVYQAAGELEGLAAVAAGLGPPASAWEVPQSEGLVGRLGADGQVAQRLARFVRLGDAAAPSALLIVIEPEIPAPPPADESAALHERLRLAQVELRQRRWPHRLLGDSPAMRLARAQAELAAGSEANLSIVGSSGSGREQVATMIHYASPSAAAPLAPLACGLLEAELIDSTVAALAKAPAAPGAPRPTLLLNDADQLPPEAQRPLAALLDGRGFPLRVVATVSRPLSVLAQEGVLRSGLAAALGTIEIRLPPLAQRREDIPLLAQFFVEQSNGRGAKQVDGFHAEALDALDAYGWPGDLDELAEVVAEAHARAEGAKIGLTDLAERLHLAAHAAAHPRRSEPPIVLDRFLAEVEVELIRRAVARSKGNKAKAARLLGISRPRLYRRMVQLGLAPAEEKAKTRTTPIEPLSDWQPVEDESPGDAPPPSPPLPPERKRERR